VLVGMGDLGSDERLDGWGARSEVSLEEGLEVVQPMVLGLEVLGWLRVSWMGGRECYVGL
jgi:hypothetical protein